VYIRVPKTGSSAVIHTGRKQKPEFDWDLTPYDVGFDTHVMVQDTPKEFRVRYREYTWIAAIRNPLTWIPSFYQWISHAPAKSKERYIGSTVVEGNWVKFLQQLQVTPASWSYDPDGIVTVHSYRQEDPSPMEEILGFKLDEPYNVTRKRRDFVPNDQMLALVNRKFYRELPFYQEP
jgi:hypothetical protein